VGPIGSLTGGQLLLPAVEGGERNAVLSSKIAIAQLALRAGGQNPRFFGRGLSTPQR